MPKFIPQDHLGQSLGSSGGLRGSQTSKYGHISDIGDKKWLNQNVSLTKFQYLLKFIHWDHLGPFVGVLRGSYGRPRLKIPEVWANKRNSNKSFKKVPLSRFARSLDNTSEYIEMRRSSTARVELRPCTALNVPSRAPIWPRMSRGKFALNYFLS